MCLEAAAVLARADDSKDMTRNATEELQSNFEVLIEKISKVMCLEAAAVLARADDSKDMTRNATEELRSNFEVLISKCNLIKKGKVSCTKK